MAAAAATTAVSSVVLPSPGDDDDTCSTALEAMCPQHENTPAGVIKCDICAGQHQGALKSAQCTSKQVQRWCTASMGPLPARQGRPLNAQTDFGAKGDGVTDDSQALQRAVNAAMGDCPAVQHPCPLEKQGRALFVPAGMYLVNTQINVRPTTGENAGYGTLGLNIYGESRSLTEIHAGAKMHAVFNFTCLSGPIPHAGAGAPKPSDGHFLSDLSIYGNYLSNYSVFAPGIVHSRFIRLFLGTSTNAGLSLGYGWINLIQDCRFSGNGIGLHTYNSANGVEVVNSIFEAQIGPGMYIEGSQHSVRGCVIEGNGKRSPHS
jgi:hypothetical protein